MAVDSVTWMETLFMEISNPGCVLMLLLGSSIESPAPQEQSDAAVFLRECFQGTLFLCGGAGNNNWPLLYHDRYTS